MHTTHICIGSLCPRILPVTVSDCTPLLTFPFQRSRTRGRNLARAAEMSVGDQDLTIARIAGRALHMCFTLGTMERWCYLASSTVLQSKRANFAVFKVFCYIHKSIQEGSILSLWEGTTSTCTALWEVTCCHVTQVCHYGFI